MNIKRQNKPEQMKNSVKTFQRWQPPQFTNIKACLEKKIQQIKIIIIKKVISSTKANK